MVMTDEEKKMTAYHEAGHAIVSVHEPASDPIHKATIIPRGRALGMVMRLPERDSYSYHRDKMHANLSVSMGGRVAEEIIFGHDKVSSGASSDIQYATSLARNMVTQWGMSDKLGPFCYLGYGGQRRSVRQDNELITRDQESVEGPHTRLPISKIYCLFWNMDADGTKSRLAVNGRIDRPDAPRGPQVASPVRGSAIPKAGKRFGGPTEAGGDEAPLGA